MEQTPTEQTPEDFSLEQDGQPPALDVADCYAPMRFAYADPPYY